VDKGKYRNRRRCKVDLREGRIKKFRGGWLYPQLRYMGKVALTKLFAVDVAVYTDRLFSGIASQLLDEFMGHTDPSEGVVNQWRRRWEVKFSSTLSMEPFENLLRN